MNSLPVRSASAKDSEVGACLSGSRNGKGISVAGVESARGGKGDEVREERGWADCVGTCRQFCVCGDGKSLEDFEWSDLI